MSEKRSIRVEILSREYPLRVLPEDEPFARKIAAFVDARMRAIREVITDKSDLTVAVLTALALAEELHLLQQEQHSMERKVRELLHFLDDLLQEGEV